jgi:hypothetical protein
MAIGKHVGSKVTRPTSTRLIAWRTLRPRWSDEEQVDFAKIIAARKKIRAAAIAYE